MKLRDTGPYWRPRSPLWQQVLLFALLIIPIVLLLVLDVLARRWRSYRRGRASETRGDGSPRLGPRVR